MLDHPVYHHVLYFHNQHKILRKKICDWHWLVMEKHVLAEKASIIKILNTCQIVRAYLFQNNYPLHFSFYLCSEFLMFLMIKNSNSKKNLFTRSLRNLRSYSYHVLTGKVTRSLSRNRCFGVQTLELDFFLINFTMHLSSLGDPMSSLGDPNKIIPYFTSCFILKFLF